MINQSLSSKVVSLMVVALCVIGAISSKAQNMTVKDFQEDTYDLSAQRNDTKRTARQDGKPAAIIKINTREKDFYFDGGTLGLVGDPVYMPSEIWIYLPSRAQKISISHPKYGQLRDYYFPVPIESGKVYNMVLDPGVGRYSTINTSTPRSTVYLDGDSIGVSPIVGYYILYGDHKIMAKNDRMEGEISVTLVNDGVDADAVFNVPMQDQSEHFGIVTISTDPDAAIVFNDKVQAMGLWTTELREGDYVVETQKLNADNSRTTFTVKPKTVNNVQAIPPVPHMGYLNIYTRPRDAQMTLDGKAIDNNDANIELPVGNHTVNFTRKNFVSTEREYAIRHNVTELDTVNMERIQFFHKNSFYLGADYVIGTFSGVNFTVGGTYQNIDLQLGFMLGMSKTDMVNFYQDNGSGSTPYQGSAQYSLNTFSAKLGYQIPLVTNFCITPQVGFAAHMLSAKSKEGTVPSDSEKAACATISAKLMYSPVQHFSIMVAPEYDIAVSKGQQYEALSDAAGFSKGGFFCHLGVIFNF